MLLLEFHLTNHIQASFLHFHISVLPTICIPDTAVEESLVTDVHYSEIKRYI